MHRVTFPSRPHENSSAEQTKAPAQQNTQDAHYDECNIPINYNIKSIKGQDSSQIQKSEY